MSFPRLSIVLTLATLPWWAGATLRISEILPQNNSGLQDVNGDYSDWIEIENTGETAVDLTGWHLTDDPDSPRKWTFAAGTVPAESFVVLFASGKNLNSIFTTEHHTNFSLSASGEYLGLINPDGFIVDQFDPMYPATAEDTAYGRLSASENFGFLTSPTPGEPNNEEQLLPVGDVEFSITRGYHSESFELALECATPDALIRYTTDGGIPTLFTARTYSGPFLVDKTTVIRARASKDGHPSSSLTTHTYLFPTDVVEQETMRESVTGHANYSGLMVPALWAQPSVCVSGPFEAISQTAEDKVSVEYIRPDGKKGFQIDCGILRVGGHSLNAYPKNNMRLYFRSEYGASKLEYPLFEDHAFGDRATSEFDRLQLRSGSHDSVFYLGANMQAPSDAQYLRNRWINDMQFVMGQPSLHGRWVHLYLNGTYWGHYQLMERPSPGHFAAYEGGRKEDYMATNKGQPVGSSDMTTWNKMISARNDLSEFSRYADVVNFIDYMLLNFYAGNDWDWSPNHNWMAGGPVGPDSGGFKFYGWDSDIILRRLNDNNLGRGGPENMFNSLINDPDFKTLFMDRAFRHLENGGALTPETVARIYNFRAEEIRLSIVPETARWGSGNWLRNHQWQEELDRLNDDFFPNRPKVIREQMVSRDWYNTFAIPRISQRGGYYEPGTEIHLSKSLFSSGEIYYTVDGTDPRMSQDQLSPTAIKYDGPFSLEKSEWIRSRTLRSGDPHIWSPINEVYFHHNAHPASPENITITAINYRPAQPDVDEEAAGFNSRNDFEFVELTNISEANVSLRDVRLLGGIRLNLAPEDKIIPPGERVYLVGNSDAFRRRYGIEAKVIGVFEGNLSNDGERLFIRDENDQPIVDFIYNDQAPWPTNADGEGAFLVAIDPQPGTNLNDPSQWRDSDPKDAPSSISGSGNSDYVDWITGHLANPAAREPTADPDGDRLNNISEFALGGDPAGRDSPLPGLLIGMEPDGTILYSFPQRKSGVIVQLQFSEDMSQWTHGRATLETRPPINIDASYEIKQFSDSQTGSGYARLFIKTN